MQKMKSSLTVRLRGYIKEMMKDLNVPGAAVAIIKDGEIILSEGFGYRDIENKKPVTLSTIWYSVSLNPGGPVLSAKIFISPWLQTGHLYVVIFSIPYYLLYK